jgi:hypothetical protein
LYHPDTPISVGSDVAIIARSFGVYTMNACRFSLSNQWCLHSRIIYVLDDVQLQSDVRRFGFAYGTLEAHVARYILLIAATDPH